MHGIIRNWSAVENLVIVAIIEMVIIAFGFYRAYIVATVVSDTNVYAYIVAYCVFVVVVGIAQLMLLVSICFLLRGD